MDEIESVGAIIGVAVMFASVFGLGLLLYKAGGLPGNGPLIVSLTMLTLVAIIAALLEEGEQAFVALAGTGLGALAAALASVYRYKDGKPPAGGDDDEPAA